MDISTTDYDWVKITHSMVPDKTGTLRTFIRHFLLFFHHCLECTSLSGCYFKESNYPDIPHHDHCDCMLQRALPLRAVKTTCDLRKFTQYIFSENSKNSKKALFELLGFSYYDSYDLKLEYERQAAEKYSNGEYVLNSLNSYGQRINIVISLNKNGRYVEFISGWLVCPMGELVCVTPYGDK